MIARVGMPQARRVGKLMLGKTQKQALKQSFSNVQKIALPSAKELEASYIVLINKGKVLAKGGEGCDDLDYCSPLFP